VDTSTAGPDAPVLNVVGVRVALGPMRRDLMALHDRSDLEL
jgi:hypothetical protein